MKFKIIGILVSLSFLVFGFVSASQTFFEVDKTIIRAGDIFEVSFFINTEGEDINAIEGKIIFPEKYILLKEIRDGSSIINFWVERPNLINGEISFAGIIPGGYLSKKGFIFSLIFQALEDGGGLAEVKSLNVLANDGQGTPVETITKDTQIQIFQKTETPVLSTSSIFQNETFKTTEPFGIKDSNLPEIFEPKVVSDINLLDGKYFLVFATQDKGSGIDYYEVREQKVLTIFKSDYVIWENNWNKVDNLHVLGDQSLHSFIYVKAVDKAGNERIAIIHPKNQVKLFEIWWFWAITVLSIVLFLGVFLIIKKIRKTKEQKVVIK